MNNSKALWLLRLSTFFPLTVFLSIALANVILAITVVGFFIFFNRDYLPKTKFPVSILIFYILLQFVSTLFSPISTNWKSWLEEASVFAAFSLGLIVGREPKNIVSTFQWLGYLIIPISIYSVYQYFYGWDLIRGMRPLLSLFHRYHAIGFQDFYLTFAGLVGLALPLVVTAAKRLWLSLAISLSCLTAILSTMARSIILGTIIGFVLFVILGTKKQKLVFGASLIVLILLSTFVFTATSKRLSAGVRLNEQHQLKGDPTRMEIWQSSLKIIKDYPVLGIGNSNWDRVFERYRNPNFQYSSTAHPHNDYLSCAVEYGLLGLMAFIAFWVSTLLYLFQKWRRTTTDSREWYLAFFISIGILLFGGLFQNYQTDAENALLLWYIVGMALKFEGDHET